jgi:hypothetical protein
MQLEAKALAAVQRERRRDVRGEDGRGDGRAAGEARVELGREGADQDGVEADSV